MKTWSFEDSAIEGSPNALGLPLNRSVSVNANAAERTSAEGFGGFDALDADAAPATIVARTTTARTMVPVRFLFGMSSS